jgi:hypothetical protein
MPIFGHAPNNIYKKLALINRRSGATIEGGANKQKGGQEMKHRIEMVAIWFANRSMAD